MKRLDNDPKNDPWWAQALVVCAFVFFILGLLALASW